MAGHRCARATFIMEAIVIATELFGAQEKSAPSQARRILLTAKTGSTRPSLRAATFGRSSNAV